MSGSQLSLDPVLSALREFIPNDAVLRDMAIQNLRAIGEKGVGQFSAGVSDELITRIADMNYIRKIDSGKYIPGSVLIGEALADLKLQS